MSDRLDEILFKLRTFREVEHNDNQWSTEFVYSLDKAKQALQSYIDSKIIEARGGLDKPSDTASVGGNQVVDPILVSELFKMVYQWGKFGVVVDSSAPAFQEQLKEVIGSLK